jgi:hypothetical protein
VRVKTTCFLGNAKKVAEATWAKEAAKWDHLKMLRVIPVLGPLNKRIKAINTPSDIYVINRENVLWLIFCLNLRNKSLERFQ